MMKIFKLLRNLYKKIIGITALEQKLDDINHKVQWIYDFQHIFSDVNSALTPTRGNMYFAQAVLTKVLEIFHIVCNENGLKYWLGAGNLLGIIRHNEKSIPWDDDIDVYMPRPDYEKLMELLPKLFKNSELRFVFSGWKIKIGKYKDYQFMFDIFPIDQYYQKLETEKEKNTLFERMRPIGKYHTREQWFNSFGYESEDDWYKKQWYKDNTPVYPQKLLEKYNREKQRWNSVIMNNKTPSDNGLLLKGFERSGWSNKPEYCWDYDCVFPLGKAKYNGIEICIPGNPEIYLLSQYGDYFAFPDSFDLHGVSQKKLTSSAIASANELISLDAKEFYNNLK